MKLGLFVGGQVVLVCFGFRVLVCLQWFRGRVIVLLSCTDLWSEPRSMLQLASQLWTVHQNGRVTSM